MPIGGMITSFTSELTILPKAPPMMMPTAMSIMLPLTAKSLNSCIIPIGFRPFVMRPAWPQKLQPTDRR